MKMTRNEKIAKCSELAKEQYGDQWLAGLWGSAQVFLSERNLDLIIKVMENK